MSWYRKVVQDWNNIPSCLDHFDKELAEARAEVKIKGNVEKNSTELPAYVELRFSQLQELEAILEHLNISLRKKRSEYLRKYLENYNKATELAEQASSAAEVLKQKLGALLDQ